MKIHIESLEISCIIGLLPKERTTKQKVILNIEIEYEYKKDNFINYAIVSSLVEEHLIEKKYILLEDAIIGTKESICHKYNNIQKLYIKISKPDILANCSVGLSQSFIMN